MSTRATYEINGQNFYIHYDGYEKGAARYLYEALCYENHRSGLEGMFFRANSLAEFTESHDEHGDTQYRYTVTGHDARAALVVHAREDLDEWREIYTGSLNEFLDQQLSHEEDYKPFFQTKEQYGCVTMDNEVTAGRRLKSLTKRMLSWLKNGHDVSNLQKEITHLTKLFPEAL